MTSRMRVHKHANTTQIVYYNIMHKLIVNVYQSRHDIMTAAATSKVDTL